jgi:glycosyltransferase involved in cell wall biosynthesis
LPDLIFVSIEDWDEVWRRNQFLCAGLARRHPEMKILFVGQPRDVSRFLRTREGLKGKKALTQAPGFPNITLFHPLKLLPNSLTAGRLANEVYQRAQIRRAARQTGLVEPVLWLNPHSAVHMAGRMGERAVIYDITDDWTSFEQPQWLRKLTIRQDAALCRRADAVIVCSQRLYEMKQPLAGRLELIPNGVDASHYARVLDGYGPLPEACRDWERPVFGYVGTIHPDRVDAQLVEQIARMMERGTIALVGPEMLGEEEKRRLLGTGRVRLTGSVPYSEVPEYMRAFDVCITPHRMTAFTESLNPIKLWEYLAAGKPIVSTDVAGFRDYPELVRIARSADDFLRACLQSLEEGDELKDRRREEAARHSWDARLDAVEAVISGLSECRDEGEH